MGSVSAHLGRWVCSQALLLQDFSKTIIQSILRICSGVAVPVKTFALKGQVLRLC